MTARNRNGSCETRAAWILVVALILAVPVARAQDPAATRHPMFRTYQRPIMPRPVARPMISRAMPARPMIYRQAMPARRPILRSPRTSAAPTYVEPQVLSPRSFAPYGPARAGLPASDFHAGFQARGAAYFNSYLFGGWPLNAYGYSQVPPQYQMLPLGFGMWPACDSAAIPGRFWSAGPCFGQGDYPSLTSSYQNQSMAESVPPYYLPPLDFIIQPEAAPTSTKAQPSHPQTKPNMVVWLTNGQETEVSDWWVTQGRFYFVPISGTSAGKAQTVDLNTLDLQKTIVENEKRGRTFILNFTPPSERVTVPAPPSNQ